MSSDDFLIIGLFSSPHGIKGNILLKSYTENPEDIFHYDRLYLEDCEILDEITLVREIPNKGFFVVKVNGINDRNQALDLKGKHIFTSKKSLPPTNDEEFYYADLIGLKVFFDGVELVGSVISVQNYGASDLLEVETNNGKKVFVPFTREVVTDVNLETRSIFVAQVDGLLDV